MRVSLRWLRDYVDVPVPAQELARRLTMAGIEVEAIHAVGPGGQAWDNVYVARIVQIEPHPNADRLTLVTAEYGGGRVARVVTGATNIKIGDIVPLGLVGARYRDGHSTPPGERVLEPVVMRGVRSEGMVMSGFELGLNEDHAGILILPPDTPIGMPLAEALGDAVIELDLKGRPDCLAMLGVAREVGALLDTRPRLPVAEPRPARPRRADEPLAIEIEDADLCRRYTGVLLRNVRIGPSPAWMQQRLNAAGMRPINNVVDITNFVMLEWGQPLHAFDYETLRGGKIVVRPAREGETLLTLAEERPEVRLTPDQLVIADAERPVALAGVIGGAETEVRESTTAILLESANFKPASIRRTARRLLPRPTEASRRFERGIPPEHTLPAALRAAQLMIELAGAELVGEPVDVYPAPLVRPPIRLSPYELTRLLGVRYAPEEIERVFDRLGFAYQKPGPATDGAYVVQAPVWRLDIERPADLVEEVARIDGYDRIPTTMIDGEAPVPVPNVPMQWEEVARGVLSAAGFAEVISYTWTSPQRLGRFPHAGEAPREGELAALVDERVAPPVEPVRLANPASPETSVLRTSAIPSLLECLRDNLRHADRDVHLFEVSRIFVRRGADELPEERRVLTAVAGAYRSGPAWGARLENDFFYVKGVAEALLARMGITGHGYVAVQHPGFHPHQAAAIVLNHRPEAAGKKPVLSEEVLGIVGQVHPDVRQAFDIGQRCFVLALDFDRLIAHATRERLYRPLPDYPAVVEDLAFVIGQTIPAERLEAVIRRAGAPLVESVALFDVYIGERIPPGMRSLAYRVTYRAADHTLTNEEVAAVRAKIVQQVERQTGAKLRT